MSEWHPDLRDLPIIDELGDSLAAAAAREQAARPSWRVFLGGSRSARSLALAFALLVAAAATAGAATLYVLRGSVIPAPASRDVAPEQTPAPGTSRVSELRVADPHAGEPPWTVRLARSRTGYLCSTVGQMRDRHFGLVGMDRRFRLLAPGIVDGCGQPRQHATSLIGARVLDAPRPADVRTVVNGVGGADLRAVTVAAGGTRQRAALGDGGVFLAVVRGYPEDLGIQVTLTFAGGRVERHAFGAGSFVVPDPLGGRAWTTTAFGFGTGPGRRPDLRTCVNFRPAREVRNPPISPSACGVLGNPRRRHGYFFAARRIVPGTGGVPIQLDGDGHWGRHPARTAVWGLAAEDVTSVTVAAPGTTPRKLRLAPNRAFLALYDARVDPRSIRVSVKFRDGRVEGRSGDTNLVRRRG